MQDQIAELVPMAKILADRDIKKKLIGTVIQHADDARINPNGLEVRLGRRVLFQATGEEKDLGSGLFLKVLPGESVLISSYEDFDFRCETVHAILPWMQPDGIYHAYDYHDAGRHHAIQH